MDALDILNSLSSAELQQVDTAFPNLAPNTYEFKIVSAEIKDSASGGKYLLFSTKLNSTDAIDTAGASVAPGYPVRHMINLSPSDKQIEKAGGGELGMKACVENIKKDLAKFLEAVTGPDRTWYGNDDEALANYVDMTFFAKTRVSPERVDPSTGITYDAQTQFASFIPKTVAATVEADVPF
jgi:hypothetical protein